MNLLSLLVLGIYWIILAVGNTDLQNLNYSCLIFLYYFGPFLNENKITFYKIKNFKGISQFFIINPNFCMFIHFLHILTSIIISRIVGYIFILLCFQKLVQFKRFKENSLSYECLYCKNYIFFNYNWPFMDYRALILFHT